jgi:hypothetical protein
MRDCISLHNVVDVGVVIAIVLQFFVGYCCHHGVVTVVRGFWTMLNSCSGNALCMVATMIQ